jgi:hypothetical protein
MYEPVRFDLAGAALLWPAIAAASVSDMAAFVARQFANLAADTGPPTVEPQWATAHTIALQLQTGRLRDFSDDTSCQPTFAVYPACAAQCRHRRFRARPQPNRCLAARWSAAPLRRRLAFGHF